MSTIVSEVYPQSERSEDCSRGPGHSRRPESRSLRAQLGVIVEERAAGCPGPRHDDGDGHAGRAPVRIARGNGGLILSGFPVELLGALEYERRTRAEGAWRRETLKHYRQVCPSELWVPAGLLVRVTNLLTAAGHDIVQEAAFAAGQVDGSARDFLQGLGPNLGRRLELVLAAPTGGVIAIGYDESLQAIVALAGAVQGLRTLVVTSRLNRAAQLQQAIVDSGTWPGLFCRDVQDMEDLTIVTAAMLKTESIDPRTVEVVIFDGVPRKEQSWLREVGAFSNARKFGLAYSEDYPVCQRELMEAVFGPWIE